VQAWRAITTAAGALRRPRAFQFRPVDLFPRQAGRLVRAIASALGVVRSFDHLIRPLEHSVWNRQSDLFRRFEVDDEFKLRGLLHRQVSGLGAFENLVDVTRCAPIQVSVESTP
jgi:hypothetical protein